MGSDESHKQTGHLPTNWQLEESLFHSGRFKEKSDKFDFYERQVQRGNSDDSQRNGKPCQF